MNRCYLVMLGSLSVAVGQLLMQAAPAIAAAFQEDFENQPLGTTTPPAGWTLIDTTATPNATYAAVDSSTGAGGSSGVAGKVTSFDYANGGLPGAYMVNSTAFDPATQIAGQFDVQILHEANDDDIVFLIGDIGAELTGNAGDALVLKLLEIGSSSTSALNDGAGSRLATPSNIYDDTWYRVSFLWTPTNGSTGELAARVVNLDSHGYWTNPLTYSGFTFTASTVQCGFGSVNDTGVFDNIDVWTSSPVLHETFEGQTLGANTLPDGWTLIDMKGTVSASNYQNVAGSDGSGGSVGIGGQVNSIGSATTYTELPSRYITSASTFNSTEPLEGRFDVKISSAPNPSANDAIFVIGDVGSGLTYWNNDAISLKLVEAAGAHLGNGKGDMLVNDTSVQVANDTWYRVEFDWIPIEGSHGVFTASVFDLFTETQVGNTLSLDFTFEPLLLQFGFGSLNDMAVFDNILIVPEPSAACLLLIAGWFLALHRPGRKRS